MISMLFIAIIYMAFISLGLPDSLLGAAWPAMQPDLGVPVDSVGIISAIVTCGTIISSLLADKLLNRFGTAKVVLISVMLTAFALMGFSYTSSFLFLCLLAIPLGLGAGSVDAGLNNFVALHYSARHMSWLHCFWGVGATLGPIILSQFLAQAGGWHTGYRVISLIQWALVLILFISLPLWKQYENPNKLNNEPSQEPKPTINVFKIYGVKTALLNFFFYCSMESITGLWAATYLVQQRGISIEQAAQTASLYYGGIMVGRFVSGILNEKVHSTNLIRIGIGIAGVGMVLLLSPLSPALALFLIGFGFAPVYPNTIHETPHRFGTAASQKIIGLQMASAYTGSTVMPILFGLIATRIGLWLLPVALLLGLTGLLICCEKLRTITTQEL